MTGGTKTTHFYLEFMAANEDRDQIPQVELKVH